MFVKFVLSSCRILIDIVTSRRLLKHECRMLKSPKKIDNAKDGFMASDQDSSVSDCTLTQAIARRMIQCDGKILEQGQTVMFNAYDCFGETSLMHAAVINDLQLAR
jgi:hypothetical protein